MYQRREQFTEAMGSAGGQGIPGLFILVLLAAITAGLWLLWGLIRKTPELLAETIADAYLLPAHPKLDRSVESESRWKNLLSITAVYFMLLSLIALVIGSDLAILAR